MFKFIPALTQYKTLKNVDDMVKTAKKDSTLKTLLKKIPVKKTAVVTGIAATAVTVTQYLNDNTGCFLYKDGKKSCKIKESSCCNPKGSGFCTGTFDLNACQGYDDKDPDCCKNCNGPNMKCHRPSVYDALVDLSKLNSFFLPVRLIVMCVAVIVFVIFLLRIK